METNGGEKNLMKESFQECGNLDGRNQLEIANLKDSDGCPILPNTRKKLMTDSQIQLQMTEQRYKCLADASFEAIMIHGKGKIIDFNQRFVDLHGYSREELLTLNSAELIAPEYRDLVTEKMASGFQGTYEIVAIRKDGTTFPLEVRVRTMGTQDRALRIVVGRDLTEQRQKEQQRGKQQRTIQTFD